MKYALLIYSDESNAPMPETPEAQRVFDEYLRGLVQKDGTSGQDPFGCDDGGQPIRCLPDG